MNKLDTLKCVEVTSQRQADNGTISYYDPQARVYYNLYENGYVRRSFGRVKMTNGRWSDEQIYQLNPTRMYEREYTFMGEPRTFKAKSRVMLATHEERMECAARAVINYRKTHKKYKQLAAEHAQRLKEQRENREFRMLMTDIQDSVNQYFEGNLSFAHAINNISFDVRDAKDMLNA
jgi:hypothetical protein